MSSRLIHGFVSESLYDEDFCYSHHHHHVSSPLQDGPFKLYIHFSPLRFFSSNLYIAHDDIYLIHQSRVREADARRLGEREEEGKKENAILTP